MEVPMNPLIHELSEIPIQRKQSFLVKYRAGEFAVSLLVFIIAALLHFAGSFQREIPALPIPISLTEIVYARDPVFNHKKLPEQVPMWLLILLSFGVPIITHVLVVYVLKLFVPSKVRTFRNDSRDFVFGLFTSAAFNTLFTTFIKNIAGGFRPCFYDMCQWNTTVIWDGKSDLCTSSKWENEGRKSFPSGHASTAFAGLFFLALYLLGRIQLGKRTNNSPAEGATRMLLLTMAMTPILLAGWIAVTRSLDNWHHYQDILAGSLIGTGTAFLSYTYNYAPIYCPKTAGLPLEDSNEVISRSDNSTTTDYTITSTQQQRLPI